MRLVEEEPSYMTYGSAFEVYCARYGREVDTAIATFKNRCCARSGGPLPDSEAQRRFQLQLKVRDGPAESGAWLAMRYTCHPDGTCISAGLVKA